MLAHNDDRLLVFRRWKGPEQYLVLATLSDTGFPDGYTLQAPSIAAGRWREIFTSDGLPYGGSGVSNGNELRAEEGKLVVRIPARGLVVLRHSPG